MQNERAVLHTRDKRTVEAQARVRRSSEAAQGLKALAILTAGLAIGGFSILVPVVHLVSVWAIPLVAAAIAYGVYHARAFVERVEATCPACEAPFETEGGAWDDPMWIRCPHCTAPLRMELDRPARS